MLINRRPFPKVLLLVLTVVGTLASAADGDAVAPNEYLNRVFDGQVPNSQTLWMSGEVKNTVTKILDHEPDYLRVRYWRDNTKTVWIIDEIGKTEPITFGLVIANNQIESAEVLAFRESRGWEIKHGFFRDQFHGVELNSDLRLNRTIDGISGATLSVRAMTRISRLALYLSATLSS